MKPDDERMVNLSPSTAVSRGCIVIGYPIFVVGAAGAWVATHFVSGYARDIAWLAAVFFSLIAGSMTLAFLLLLLPAVSRGRRSVKVVAWTAAIAASMAVGAIVGAGVAVVGPPDLAASAVIALASWRVYAGRSPSRGSPRLRRRVALWLLVCAGWSAAVGAAILW